MKYQCKDCGQMFDGDMSTMTCPNCGGSNIAKSKSFGEERIKDVIIGIGIIIIIILLFKMCTSETTDCNEIVVSMTEEPQQLLISVEGIKNLKDYEIKVFNNTEEQDSIGFNGTKQATYSYMKMLEGECYSFQLYRKDRKPIKKLTWATTNEYCKNEELVPLEIDSISSSYSCDNKGYTVNIKVKDVKKLKKVSYSLVCKKGNINKEQEKSSFFIPFTDTTDWEFEVSVSASNSENTVTQIGFLKKLNKTLKKKDVQKIIDKVSKGTMSASTAQSQLANGTVKLVQTVSNISTLWGVLQEASFGTTFFVDGVEINPCTNTIRSGTLKVRIGSTGDDNPIL